MRLAHIMFIFSTQVNMPRRHKFASSLPSMKPHHIGATTQKGNKRPKCEMNKQLRWTWLETLTIHIRDVPEERPDWCRILGQMIFTMGPNWCIGWIWHRTATSTCMEIRKWDMELVMHRIRKLQYSTIKKN